MNDHKMGLVHQLPFTTDQSGFAAAVEKVVISTYEVVLFVSELQQADCLLTLFCLACLCSYPLQSIFSGF